jgi:hypothetical protein
MCKLCREKKLDKKILKLKPDIEKKCFSDEKEVPRILRFWDNFITWLTKTPDEKK